MIYIILASSWNLLAGYTGLFSLAHNTFASIAAYTSALIAVNTGLHPAITIPIGIAVATLTSYLIGVLTLRMRVIYLALATWAFAGSYEIFIRMAYRWTRGDLGLPTPRLIETNANIYYYYLALILTILSLFAIYKLVNSRIGLYIRAMRDDEVAAACMGVNIYKWRKNIFAIAGFFAGLAGAFRVHYIGLASPVTAQFDEMSIIIIMTILGGYGTFIGPIIGAPIVEIVMEVLRAYEYLRMIIFAVIVILIVLFFRGGIHGFLQTTWRKYFLIKKIKNLNKKT